MVVIRASDLEELVLRAHLRAQELSLRHWSDKEVADWLGMSYGHFQRLVRADPALAGVAETIDRPGARRPRRRWLPAKVVLFWRTRRS